MKTLILGGVRSGKSELAEQLAGESGVAVTYIATASTGDREMQARIAIHRSRRPTHWGLVEEPLALANALTANARPDAFLLVDCLTLWLTNLLLCADPDRFAQERERLLAVLPDLAGRVAFVSSETNMGITPIGELSRRYCDEAGLLHQSLARQCEQVILVVAGIPQVLKGAAKAAVPADLVGSFENEAAH